MTAKAATWVGNTINVTDYRNAVVKIGTASSANLTVKCQGAIASPLTSEVAPNFASAQSVANHWDYVQMIDQQDGNPVSGDTGFVVTGTDDFRLFAINIDNLDFLNFNVTARSAGSVTIEVQLTDNL